MNPTRQATEIDEATGARIKEAVEARDDVPAGREVSWLVQQTGLPDSTIRDAIRRGPSRAEVAVKISKALGVDLEWMLTGEARSRDSLREMVRERAAEDWIALPRYRLGEFVDARKPQQVGALPVLRSLLDRKVELAAGLWVTEMPSDALPDVAGAGETILVRDPGLDGPEPADRGVYLFLLNRAPIVRRVAHELGRIVLSASDKLTPPMPIDPDEVGRGIILLGRVVGAFSLHKV